MALYGLPPTSSTFRFKDATTARQRLITPSLAVEQELTAMPAEYFASDEGQEGIRAFKEKRDPAWMRTNAEAVR